MRTDYGPFFSAVIAALIPAILLISLAAGLQIQLMVVLALLVPGMSLAVILVSISMAWIFILFGRLKRQPRWLAGTMIVNAIAMLELLGLVLLSTRAG